MTAVSAAGISGSASASSSGVTLVDPGWIPVLSMQGGSVLQWTSVSGKNYQIWSTTDLAAPVYSDWRRHHGFRTDNPKNKQLCRSGKILSRPDFPVVKLSHVLRGSPQNRNKSGSDIRQFYLSS